MTTIVIYIVQDSTLQKSADSVFYKTRANLRSIYSNSIYSMPLTANNDIFIIEK